MPPANAHQCHISVPPINASQCHLSVLPVPYQCPVSVAYQCASVCLSVPPNSASQCRLSVPYMSAAFQCSSVILVNVNAHQCLLISASATYQCPSVQPISAHHCSLI
ncbi:unnamed protein product, partial [Staurois parvus]